MNIVGVIPARYASTRLPGKPLADICGKPMIQHCYESAGKSKFLNKIVVATDHQKVFDTVSGFGGKAIMTGKNIQTGSDRIAAALKKLPGVDIVVNIQGDEPFIPGFMIDQAIEPLLFDSTVMVSTLAKRIVKKEELLNPSVVKVVFDMENNALYFSRSPIPFMRDSEDIDSAIKSFTFLKHIGLYVYRVEALFKFTSLDAGILENVEKLEQLRMLENGIKIKVVETNLESISVDTANDLEIAKKYYLKELKKGKDAKLSAK
ncbi:MAG: 3-deoxy-manno-octulosonate cytidylyltransferase [Ignavibacteriaceae bacterium]|nr:3-deoxy-manno-octulosonate cytidylyltransferase [Ignavibacteriaceae bacterium]